MHSFDRHHGPNCLRSTNRWVATSGSAQMRQFDNLAEEAANIAERAAPCTDSFSRINGKCFQMLSNGEILPSEIDVVIQSVPCQTITVGVRKCARDPDCAYVNFDNRTKQCMLISESYNGLGSFGVPRGVPRYNAGLIVGDEAC